MRSSEVKTVFLSNGTCDGVAGRVPVAIRKFSAETISKSSARSIRIDFGEDRSARISIATADRWRADESSPKSIRIERADDFEIVSAENFLIATGTRPATPSHGAVRQKTVFTSDDLIALDHLPKTMIIVGGGVIGVEYACMMATLGVKVTLVEGRNEVLGFLDHEITEAFQYQMRRAGMTLRLGEKVPPSSTLSTKAMATVMAMGTVTAPSTRHPRIRQAIAGRDTALRRRPTGNDCRARAGQSRTCR